MRDQAMLQLLHIRPDLPFLLMCFTNHRWPHRACESTEEACLNDILRAQTHGYPERLRPKVMLRKAECLVTLGRLPEASQAIEDIERHFATTPAPAAPPFQILQENLHRLKMKVQEKKILTKTSPAALAKASNGHDLREENEQISSASPSVGLRTHPLKGRHLIATKDILPGELLVKEDAFVSVLNPGDMPPLRHSLENKWDTRVTNGDLYCHRCLKHTLATVPCDGCSYAKYCSHACTQQAWELYHSTECSLGGLLLALGVFCHVALRATLIARFEDGGRVLRKLCDEGSDKDICLPENKNLVKTLSYCLGEDEENSKSVETLIPGCDIDGKYQNNYNTVLSLLPHTENHSPEHKFLCALSASALCRQLEAAGLQALTAGGKPSPREAAEAPELCLDVNVWGVAVLRHMLQLQCNAQAITTLQQTEHTVVGEIEDDLAQAYAALGEWQKSATHLQKSLRVVEVRHGPSSVEIGHELFKLAQIFFNGCAVPEALNTIQRAEEVLLVHCGPWNDEIQELRKMKSCLLDLLPSPGGPSA
ncbi:SET and MYND domain-containing protein 4 [Tupaia chinensis]|uniref:SET and MYND domain-containing protein 4 n=1 Tax=Tupaia chinensis TaxID=246437 RepID=L8Y842_TUPCH|nr:SET and MYND domain-containing protein 4 [Tupaia chinensis]